MRRLPENLVQKIKDATDIVAIVSEHVKLEKKGRHYTGLCPFHNEKKPSFSVNPELQIYKCFGCGAGGPVFKFVQDIAGISFLDAVYALAQRCDVELPEREKGAQ